MITNKNRINKFKKIYKRKKKKKKKEKKKRKKERRRSSFLQSTVNKAHPKR